MIVAVASPQRRNELMGIGWTGIDSSRHLCVQVVVAIGHRVAGPAAETKWKRQASMAA